MQFIDKYRSPGGIQHFLEYPTAPLLQAHQQPQQPQFIQHNGQLVQVIRPTIGYPSTGLVQPLQLQQQQTQQLLAAQLQGQQLTAVQQPGGATLWVVNTPTMGPFAQKTSFSSVWR
jgi:hypothetical protein